MRRILHFALFLFFCVTTTWSYAATDTLKVGYTSAPPFIINQTNTPEGINIWLWKNVAKDLKQHYTLVEIPFSEMMDSLNSGGIDVSINPLTLTAARSEKIIFTSPFYVSNSTVVLKEGHFDKAKNFFRAFFSWEFFTGILILILIISLFGMLTWYFERDQNQQFRKGIKGLWDGIYWSAVTMTTVGYGDKVPKSRGGKVVSLIWMFTALLFVSGLTASIASSIISVSQNNNVFDIEDFQSKRIGTINNTGTYNYLRSRFFKNVKAFDNVQSGLDALDIGDIDAFMYDEPILAHRLNAIGNDHLKMLPIKFHLQLYGFGVSKEQGHLVPALSERILHYTNSLEWPIILQEYGLQVY